MVVLGHPEYYPRFGFRRADEVGLRCKWPGTEEAFMVLELAEGALSGLSGLISYEAELDAF